MKLGNEREFETGIPRDSIDNNLDDESLVTSLKKVRLPKSVRIHIRRLKESGQLEEAIRIRKLAIGKRNVSRSALEKAHKELVETAVDVVTNDDPAEVAKRSIQMLWLLSATGQVHPKDRTEEMREFLDALQETHPQILLKVEPSLPEIRDSVIKLMPRVG